VQHACGIGSSIKQHFETVKVSISQLSTCKDGLIHKSDELLRTIAKIVDDPEMAKQFKEIQRLQDESK